LADLGTRLYLKPRQGERFSKPIAFTIAKAYNPMQWSGEEIWDAVEKVFYRPYWNRVWIVQEIVQAVDIDVCCGSKSIPWGVLLCDAGDNERGLLPARLLENMPWRLHCQRGIKSETLCALLYCLKSCRESLASDQRDKIFGFLGIADDCSSGQLQVDYSKSVYEVYQEASTFLTTKAESTEDSIRALVYSSLGSPLPPDTGSSGMIENSFHVIGHIVGVYRRGSPVLMVYRSSITHSEPESFFFRWTYRCQVKSSTKYRA
jgi:hypothetical protein